MPERLVVDMHWLIGRDFVASDSHAGSAEWATLVTAGAVERGCMKPPRDALFRTILHDTHFWIPLLVLIAGMLFLRMLH